MNRYLERQRNESGSGSGSGSGSRDGKDASTFPKGQEPPNSLADRQPEVRTSIKGIT